MSNLQVQIKNLEIYTKLGAINILQMFEELNIYDSLFTPCMSGNILITDSIGLSSKLFFDGSEVLVIEMSKFDDYNSFKKSFRIYKQSGKAARNETSEKYVLHFISEEYLLSQQMRVRKAFTASYSDIALRVMRDHLGITNSMINYVESSVGIKDFLASNKTPFEILDICSKKAVNEKLSPTFLFFENVYGYNFATASSLISLPQKFDLNYDPKNIAITNQQSNGLMGIRSMEVLSNHDVNKNIQSGLYGGTFIGVDLRNRIINKKIVSFNEIMKNNEHAGKAPDVGQSVNKFGLKNTDMIDSRVVVYPISLYDTLSSYVNTNYPSVVNTEDDTYNFIFQREASIRNITQKRLKLVMPGNFSLTSGINVGVKLPLRSMRSLQDSKDDSLSGKYIIIAARHIIRIDRHETIMEVSTDSTDKKEFYNSGYSSLGALQEYE